MPPRNFRISSIPLPNSHFQNPPENPRNQPSQHLTFFGRVPSAPRRPSSESDRPREGRSGDPWTQKRKNPSSISWLNYCWWKKFCTTWDVQNLVNNGINYLSTGAGFLPSTVYLWAIFVQFLNLNVSGILFGDSFPKPPFKVTNRRFGRYNLPRYLVIVYSIWLVVSTEPIWKKKCTSQKSNWIISPNFRDEDL